MSWISTWLKDVVDVVAFSYELGVRKPHPEMYLAVTRRLNVQPEERLFPLRQTPLVKEYGK